MRELDIFSGWGRIPGRVVVPGQGAAGTKFQGFPEEFSRADEARRGRAVGQHTVSNEVALGVKGEKPEAFLGPALGLWKQVGAFGTGRADARPGPMRIRSTPPRMVRPPPTGTPSGGTLAEVKEPL